MDNEQFIDMPFPTAGLDVTDEFGGQKGRTTTEGVNVRTFEAQTRRGRGGVRPGISRYIDDRPGGNVSMIQHLNYIVDPQAVALIAPDETIGVDYIPDPSTNNLRERNPPGRYVRRRGNARQTNRKRPGIAKLNPDILWLDPADIWLGTALSGVQLNAVASDPNTHVVIGGVYTYVPPAGTVLVLGGSQPQGITMTFVPTNTLIYNNAGPFATGITVKGIAHVHNGATTVSATTGNFLVVGVVTNHTASGVTVTVTDNQGNGYTQAGTYSDINAGGTFIRVSLWYAVAGATASTTVTATPSAGSGGAVGIAEYNGVLAFDSSSQSSGLGAGETITAGICSVSLDREMVVSVAYAAADPLTVPSGFIARFGGMVDNAAPTLGTHSGLVDPQGGTSSASNQIRGGAATNIWAACAASFTHRTV